MLTLTEKERLFVIHVNDGQKQSDAAKIAGYSSATASPAASRLMKKPEIIKALALIKIEPDHPAFKSYVKVPSIKIAPQAVTEKQQEKKNTVNNFIESLKTVAQDLSLEKSSPEVYLESLMLDEECDPRMRFEAAKALLPYRSRKLAETGKKEQAEQDARQAMGAYGTASPPKLRVVG